MVAPNSKPPGMTSQEWGERVWGEQASEIITARLDTLATHIMERHFKRNPELATRYNARQRALYFRDTKHNLTALAAAILLQTPGIFGEYMVWVKELLQARNIPTAGLEMHLECMKDELVEMLPPELGANIGEYVDMGIEGLAKTGP